MKYVIDTRLNRYDLRFKQREFDNLHDAIDVVMDKQLRLGERIKAKFKRETNHTIERYEGYVRLTLNEVCQRGNPISNCMIIIQEVK